MHLAKTKQQGITIIELMITLAVVALIAGMAGPSFSTMLKRNKLEAESDMLQSAINYARSEAVKRGNNVTLCAGSGIVAGNPCNGDDWSEGWVVYSDVADNSSRTIRVLKVQENPIVNLVKSDIKKITFTNDGTPLAKGDFTFCDPTKKVQAVSMTMSISGSSQIVQGETIACN